MRPSDRPAMQRAPCGKGSGCLESRDCQLESSWGGVQNSCLENDDASRQELLSDVELILRDSDITEKEVGQSIASDFRLDMMQLRRQGEYQHVSTVQLEGVEAQCQEGHNDEIEPSMRCQSLPV